jgi:hypothetical protein
MAHDKGNAMRRPKSRGRDSDAFITEVNARLSGVAAAGATVELILVVKGRVWPVPGRHGERWRVRTGRGHVMTFRPEFVMAFNGTHHADESAQRPLQPVCEADPCTVKEFGGAG